MSLLIKVRNKPLFFVRSKHQRCNISSSKASSSAALINNAAKEKDGEEYTTSPLYPPILDLSHEKRLERKKEDKREEIKLVKTVEEKQIKLNMPKYYGFKCYMFNEHSAPYNSLPLVQHITRTHLKEADILPNYFNDLKIAEEDLEKKIIDDVQEAILMHFNLQARKQDSINQSSLLCKEINRVILNNVKCVKKSVKELEIDFDTRVESFWFAGGMNPPENIKRYRLGNEWRKDTVDEPTDRAIQYIGAPLITLRSELPLEPIISIKEAENPDLNVPYFKYDPRVVATTTEHRHAANIPGYWPGESKQFGILSYNSRDYLLNRNFGDLKEQKEAIHRQGILASFGWLTAQANMLGFNTFNDITYPLTTQLLITNGQLFSFYIYQLNTMSIFGKNPMENKLKNICWSTPELKLFEEVQIKDNKIIGFNPDVLKMLIKLYLNEPQERLGINLRPYLSKEEQLAADYTNEDKRQWLEREYKYLVSNRPRFKPDYEVYLWEKIYKIDHETRFMEKKLRPFELGIKPSNRTLDDRQPNYIPRALRPHLKKNKGRYAKEYFP